MKKLFVAAAVALLATPLFASEMKFDAKVGYARMEGGANGFVVGPAFYYSLYSDEGFVKDISLGLGFDFTMAKLAGEWMYNLLIGPEARVEMPYSYFKLGFGYDYFRTKVLGTTATSSALGMKFGLGGLYEISEGMKMGLDFTFAYKLTDGRAWMINVGPVFSFDL
jgi:hypothetical protein